MNLTLSLVRISLKVKTRRAQPDNIDVISVYVNFAEFSMILARGQLHKC